MQYRLRVTKADSENELNNCLRLLKGLQNAILIENYKPKQRMADSLKSLILEFSEPLPDWVYERDYLLDWIKLYSNNGSFTYITPEANIMVNSTTTKKQKRKTKKSGLVMERINVIGTFLNSSDVIVCLKKMAGEAVSERVGRRAFGQLASENG